MNERMKQIVGLLFWIPLIINAILTAFHYFPLKALYWHLGILAGIYAIVILGIFTFYWLISLAFWAKPKGFIQRMVFPLWMWHLKRCVPDHPLVAFPYIMQVEIVVPQVFKEQGMVAAHTAIIKWSKEFPGRMTEMVKKLAEAKKELQNEKNCN